VALVYAGIPTPKHRPETVAGAFGLSRAEAEVALDVAAGHGIKEVARARRVCVTTVRTQLQSVFLKTGTSKQIQLAGLLHQLPLLEADLHAG